jgi:hypothetical protein
MKPNLAAIVAFAVGATVPALVAPARIQSPAITTTSTAAPNYGDKLDQLQPHLRSIRIN